MINSYLLKNKYLMFNGVFAKIDSSSSKNSGENHPIFVQV